MDSVTEFKVTAIVQSHGIEKAERGSEMIRQGEPVTRTVGLVQMGRVASRYSNLPQLFREVSPKSFVTCCQLTFWLLVSTTNFGDPKFFGTAK